MAKGSFLLGRDPFFSQGVAALLCLSGDHQWTCAQLACKWRCVEAVESMKLVNSQDCAKRERCRLRVVDSCPLTTIRRKTFNARENFLSSSLNDVIRQTHSCSPCQNGPSSSTKNALSVHAWPAKPAQKLECHDGGAASVVPAADQRRCTTLDCMGARLHRVGPGQNRSQGTHRGTFVFAKLD